MSSVIIGTFTTFPELGGTYGLINLPKAELFGWTLQNPSDWVLPLLVVVAIMYWLCWPHRRVALRPGAEGHPRGRAWPCGRSARASSGSRSWCSRITSALAGARRRPPVGFLQLATPGLFGFSISLTIFAMVIVGGMGNLTGSVIGAAAAGVAGADPHPGRSASAPTRPFFVRLIVYGLLLVRAHARCAPRACCPRASRCCGGCGGSSSRSAGRVEMVRAEGWAPTGQRRRRPAGRGPSTSSSRRRRPRRRASVAGNGDERRGPGCGRRRRWCWRWPGCPSASAASSPPTT